MRTFWIRCGIALLLGFGATAGAAAQQPSPKEAADRFYQMYLRMHISGLPDDEQSKLLFPLLSPDLRQLIEAARVEQDKAIKEHPDEKPPWIEGDLLSSLWEGAQSFKVGAQTVRGDRADVTVQLTYESGDSTLRWSDTLVLVHDADDWLVDDILLNGEWDFKSGGSLRQILGSE
jgi:hypothetical protein